jgi:hypothetical protein
VGRAAVLSLDDQLAEMRAAIASFTDMGGKLGVSRSIVAGRIDGARKSGDRRFTARSGSSWSMTMPELVFILIACRCGERSRKPPPVAQSGSTEANAYEVRRPLGRSFASPRIGSSRPAVRLAGPRSAG